MSRQLCECGEPAVFPSPTKHKLVARGDHELCRRCWFRQREREVQARAARFGRRRHELQLIPDVNFDTQELRVLRAALLVLDALLASQRH